MPFLPFLILGLVLSLKCVIGPQLLTRAPREEARRRATGMSAASALALGVVVNFVYIYPLLTARTLTKGQWLSRMWFHSWH